MSIKDMMLKQKGKWMVKFRDKSKWIIDLTNMSYDSFEWYKATGTLDNEIDDLDKWFKGVIEYKRMD